VKVYQVLLIYQYFYI